jgi:hypothetical protein
VYVASQDGKLYELPKTFNELRSTDPRLWKSSQRRYDYYSLSSVIGDTEFALTSDGRVLSLIGAKKPSTPTPALQGQKFDRMIGPIYWSKELETL